jgi:hypothetical protein
MSSDGDLVYPDPDQWEHADPAVRIRARRSLQTLKSKRVPVYPGPLFCDPESTFQLRTASEVAERTMVLWAVALLGDSTPRHEALEIIDRLDLWHAVTPLEKEFLDDPEPGAEARCDFKWRFEAVWVLLWAIGDIQLLEWPAGVCDVNYLVKVLMPRESDPGFLRQAHLRSSSELLDQRDLIGRLAWAIRDAYLHRGGMVPSDLNWKQGDDWLPVRHNAAASTVYQRHYTLNWLVGYPRPATWDDVDTPT